MLVSAETPSTSDTVINVKDKGAQGNGMCDDRAFIQAAIDEATSVGGSVFFPPGTYMVSRATGTSRCLFITGNVTLYGVKGSSVIKQMKDVSIAMDPRASDPGVDARALDPCALDRHAVDSCSLFQISNARNVSIRDLELHGNQGDARNGISLIDSDGVVIDSCSFRNISAGSILDVRQAGSLPLDGTPQKMDQSNFRRSTNQRLTLDAVTTTSDNALVVQVLGAFPGGGTSNWDDWTNQSLDHYVQILQDLNSSGGGDFAAAAGVLLLAGPSGTGSVRQHAPGNQFGNATYSFALRPPPPPPPPRWITNGAKTQGKVGPDGKAGTVSPPWPAETQANDVGILVVVVSDTDTGATVSDPQWQELPKSPALGRSNVGRGGVKLHLFGARASAFPTLPPPAPTVMHDGPHIMAEIMLFRGADPNG